MIIVNNIDRASHTSECLNHVNIFCPHNLFQSYCYHLCFKMGEMKEDRGSGISPRLYN